MSETHTVHLVPVDVEFEVEEGETILDAAFRQGISLPHGCKEGQCSACKCILLEGEVELKKYSTFALSETERDTDHILLCRALADSDVDVELLNYDEELLSKSIAVKDFSGAIVDIKTLTHDIRQVAITLDSPLKFWAGQYVDITVKTSKEETIKLAAAVEPTLGPKGMNAMIDRPIGTPFISRDGVSIASEIELFDRFENMGAQVVREVSMQTNEVAGDGTTTAIVLANALIQKGVKALEIGGRPVDLCRGIDQAVSVLVDRLKSSARPVDDNKMLERVAEIAATNAELGALVAEAFNRVGADGVITADYGVTIETTLNIVEGMSFDRGYISHHMVTDVEQMLAVLDNPYVLITDQKIKEPAQLDAVRAIADADNRPLLIIAEEVQPEVVVKLLDDGGNGKYVVVHPPEYGQWRQAMLDDLAILLGGKVLARDLGKRLEDVSRDDLGECDQVRVSSNETVILRGKGDPEAIAARRIQVQRQFEMAPPNIEQDKLRERMAKMSGGTAIIYAGGATPVEQKRTIQLVEDALNAVRAAFEEGVVSGGGSALIHSATALDEIATQAEGDVARGIEIVREILAQPLTRIARNAGRDPQDIVAEVQRTNSGHGYNAATGEFVNMYDAGIIDPVRVTYTALTNAASVATLILTTETLIGDLGEDEDPTAGPALGGGAEDLGRA